MLLQVLSASADETGVKFIFHLATLFARREAKTRIRHRDWLKLAGEKFATDKFGTVPTFLSVRTNKFAKWKNRLNGESPLGSVIARLMNVVNLPQALRILAYNHLAFGNLINRIIRFHGWKK